MRWIAKSRDQWHVGFAFLPVTIGDDVVWLERYLYQDRGEYTAVKLFQPRAPGPMSKRECALFDAAWECVAAIRRSGPLPLKTPSEAADLAYPILIAALDDRNAVTLSTAEA